jgi:hypothetical protein
MVLALIWKIVEVLVHTLGPEILFILNVSCCSHNKPNVLLSHFFFNFRRVSEKPDLIFSFG